MIATRLMADQAEAPAHNGHAPRSEANATLITGGAGFLGTNLAERLLASGRRVVILDNLSRPGVRRNAEFLERVFARRVEVRVGDVRDRGAVRGAIAGASEVYHLAAQVAAAPSLLNPEEDFSINVGGTMTVLEELRRLRRRCPLIFTSTSKVYGCLTDLELMVEQGRYRPASSAAYEFGIDERRPLEFRSPYGCSKGAADQYVLDYARSYGLLTCVLRMSCVFGPHQCAAEGQGGMAHLLRAAAEGRPITIRGDGRQVRDALYVTDAVDALLLARERIAAISGRAFNIGGGPANALSVRELLAMAEDLAGPPPRVVHAGWLAGDQRWYVSDTRAFQAATGWRPRVRAAHGIEVLHRAMKGDRATDAPGVLAT